jgi:hypothetical protein
VKAGYAHDEDASTISRQIANRVLQLKKAREQRKLAAKTASPPAQTIDGPVQTTATGTVPLAANASSVAITVGKTKYSPLDRRCIKLVLGIGCR